MSRPHRRRDSAVPYFRKRVPEDLRAIVGKSEIKISLRTRDPDGIKAAHAKLSAEIEARWAQLRRGVITVSQKQAVAMAGDIYRELVAAHEDNPGEPADWAARLLTDWVFLRPEKVTVHKVGKDAEATERMLELMQVNRHGRIVQEYLDRKGVRVDDASLLRIKQAMNAAIMQGREKLLRNAAGDYRPDPEADRFPELDIGKAPHEAAGKAPVGQRSPLDVFDSYAKESKLTPATIKRWRPIVAGVQEEQPRLSDITPEWCIAWKNRLVGSGLNNNTIRNGYLASMRSLCNWAVGNREIARNPFDGITIKASKQRKMRQKGFFDSEVKVILRATHDPVPRGFLRSTPPRGDGPPGCVPISEPASARSVSCAARTSNRSKVCGWCG